MGCQTEVTLGNDLVFSITTHDPDTGILTDADSAPSYRVYEEETAVAILTGNMAKLDDAYTTGFYTELIACTAANGFENDKSYTVYIEATVDGDTGGICYGFLVQTVADDVWSSGTRTLTQSAAQVISVVRGSAITLPRATYWSFSITGMGSVADKTKLYFTIKHKRTDADSAALVQIEESAGLLYLNSSTAGTPGNGTLTVDDAVAGNVTITLTDDETTKLTEIRSLYYDFKKITAAGSYIMTSGRFNISDVVTESIT